MAHAITFLVPRRLQHSGLTLLETLIALLLLSASALLVFYFTARYPLPAPHRIAQEALHSLSAALPATQSAATLLGPISSQDRPSSPDCSQPCQPREGIQRQLILTAQLLSARIPQITFTLTPTGSNLRLLAQWPRQGSVDACPLSNSNNSVACVWLDVPLRP